MKTPERPFNELDRQAEVDRSALLDTKAEERFDRLTRMACRMFDVPIALVTFVDKDRQWFKSSQGLKVPETPRDISFCGHAILDSDLFIIEDAYQDERFQDNPLVAQDPYIRFYAGAPIHSGEGCRLGTLCLIDRKPRPFPRADQSLLRDLADCVEREINLHAASQVYRELRQRERATRAVIEGTLVGTWEWNVQTGETVFNERWAEICGYRLEELEPVDIQTWLNLTHPEDLAESERRLNEHFLGNSGEYDCRCRMRHKEGHWVWVHDRGRVFDWTDDGRPLVMYGTHADVTGEMERLERMRQQNTALGILNELALDPERDDNERIRRALQLGSDYLNLPTGIVSEITSDVYTVIWFSAPEDAGLEEGQRFALSDTYCAITMARGGSLAISHMAISRYRDHRCYDQFGLESYIAAPLQVQDRLFGTLNFSSPEPRSTPFSDTERTFVTLLARWISGLIERKTGLATLTKLVEQAPGMLYQYHLRSDGGAAFPFSSPGIREIYGVHPDDVAEDASAVFNVIHPNDLALVGRSIAESAERLTPWQQQYRVRHGDDWSWVEGRATPEQLADNSVMWHGYITDIDDKKRVQLALQESEEQLRRLFELSPIGIGLNDLRSSHFLDVNEALRGPTGYSLDELLTLSFDQLIPGGLGVSRNLLVVELTKTGRFGPYEQDIRRKDGSTYPAIVQGLRIISSSGQPLVWTLIEDISERKKAELMKNEFISTISHELRTPLTSIAGSLGLIAGGALGQLPENVNRLVAIAARNSDQLKQLIDDLLDMEKLVSGKMRMHPRLDPIHRSVQTTIERLNTYAVNRNVTIHFQDRCPGQHAIVDHYRLEQALTNLLSNAIKFSPEGGEVVVETRLVGDQLRILVRDQGPGVPESFRPRIFQKFAQADSTATRGRGGTGLGLAITREIMTQMEGAVGYHSVEGQGATFWLELQAREPESD